MLLRQAVIDFEKEFFGISDHNVQPVKYTAVRPPKLGIIKLCDTRQQMCCILLQDGGLNAPRYGHAAL